MAVTDLTRTFGNKLYEVAFPLYRPLYSAFKSYVDRAERHLLANNLFRGDVVVDAGANIGVYSRFLSKCVGTAGTVHSFEPSPENFARLRAAVAGLPNVLPRELAVSDTTGQQLLYISSCLNVDHRTYPTAGELRRTVSVRSTRLDDYFKPDQRVDLLKLDIQGYELHALRGAQRVLAENPTVKLLLEFWPFGLRSAGSSPEALLAFLQDHEFRVFDFKNRRLEEYSGAAPLKHDDLSYFNLFARRKTTAAGRH